MFALPTCPSIIQPNTSLLHARPVQVASALSLVLASDDIPMDTPLMSAGMSLYTYPSCAYFLCYTHTTLPRKALTRLGLWNCVTSCPAQWVASRSQPPWSLTTPLEMLLRNTSTFGCLASHNPRITLPHHHPCSYPPRPWTTMSCASQPPHINYQRQMVCKGQTGCKWSPLSGGIAMQKTILLCVLLHCSVMWRTLMWRHLD